MKRGEAIQWMGGLVRISTGKAIQWRGPGHSVNRRTLKSEKLLSSSPSRKSALMGWCAGRHVDHPCGWQISPCTLLEKSLILGFLSCLRATEAITPNEQAQGIQLMGGRVRFFFGAREPAQRKFEKWCGFLAAQSEIPPYIAQYPFEIVSQRGVSHPFALFS